MLPGGEFGVDARAEGAYLQHALKLLMNPPLAETTLGMPNEGSTNDMTIPPGSGGAAGSVSIRIPWTGGPP